MKRAKITTVVSLVLAAVFILSLSSCGKDVKADYTVNYETSAGVISFFVPPLPDSDEATRKSDLKTFATDFEKLFVKITDSSVGLLSEINTPVDVILDCDEKDVALFENLFTLSRELGILELDKDAISFEKTIIRKSDKNITLDFTKIAPDYALSKTVEDMTALGYTNGFVLLGNTYAVLGPKDDGTTYNIGIPKGEDKNGEATYYGHFCITDGYVSMSENDSGAKSFVFSSDAYTSHIFSEKISAMSKDELNGFYSESDTRFEALVITKKGKIIKTSGLENSSIFTEETTADK